MKLNTVYAVNSGYLTEATSEKEESSKVNSGHFPVKHLRFCFLCCLELLTSAFLAPSLSGSLLFSNTGSSV